MKRARVVDYRVSLSPQLAVSLDAVRSGAAFYVVIHHLFSRFYSGPFDLMFRFGQEAVIVFFLLSGFVIHANEHNRVADVRGYAARRLFRIYPPLFVAMIVSALVAGYDGDLAQRFQMQDLLCNLVALQDLGYLKPGTICAPFLDNLPLWSLSYELLFYLFYPMVLPLYRAFSTLTQHAIGVLTALLIMSYMLWPSHFLLLPSYFLIWWCGAMMAEAYLTGNFNVRSLILPLGYLIAAFVVWAAGPALGVEIGRFGTYPLLNLRHFGSAAIFMLIALSPIGSAFVKHVGAHFAAGWGWLSSISYGVYILHYPLLAQWSYAGDLTGLAVAMILLIVLAYLADNRLNRLSRAFRAYLFHHR